MSYKVERLGRFGWHLIAHVSNCAVAESIQKKIMTDHADAYVRLVRSARSPAGRRRAVRIPQFAGVRI